MCLVPQKGGNLSQGRQKTEAQTHHCFERFSVGEDLKTSHLLFRMNEEASVVEKVHNDTNSLVT